MENHTKNVHQKLFPDPFLILENKSKQSFLIEKTTVFKPSKTKIF